MRVVDLLLTEEEKLALGVGVVFLPENSTLSVADARGRIIDRVAQAALAKALWGVVDWLCAHDVNLITDYHLVFVGDRIKWELEQAGIPRPGGER